MYRQSPNRNQRSKGIKVKHVLQICLLLAVCFWLIYQVKHSHDKKREFDESDAKASLRRGSSDNIIKLGRKDIRTQVETITKYEKHDEESEEEETTGEDVEENKTGKDGPEDKKVEEKEDEEMGDGEDEIDEHEREKLDTEVDREEDFEDDEKEREDVDEKEIEEKNSEDGNSQLENESSVEDADRDGNDGSAHEAREQQYNADDASSAVTHDTQIGTTENENTSTENSNEHLEYIVLKENKESNREETSKGENRKELEVEGGKMATGDNQSDVTTKEKILDDSENGSSSNNPVNSTHIAETKDAESTSGEFSSSSNNIKFAESENIIRSEASVEMGNNRESSTEKNDSIKPESSDTGDGTDEVWENTMTENLKEVLHDSIDFSDSSNALEEKDVLQTEGTNTEDAAAE